MLKQGGDNIMKLADIDHVSRESPPGVTEDESLFFTIHHKSRPVHLEAYSLMEVPHRFVLYAAGLTHLALKQASLMHDGLKLLVEVYKGIQTA
jgi:hypothetical protein